MQGAPSMSVSDSQDSSAGSRRTHVPCVVQQGQMHPDGYLPWQELPKHCLCPWSCSPGFPQSSAIAKTSTNTSLHPMWSTALGAACRIVEAWAISSCCFCTVPLNVDLALRNLSCITAQKDHTASPATRTLPTPGGEGMLMPSKIFNSCLTTLMNSAF